MKHTINEMEDEFEFFKQMATNKLTGKELDEECLQRILEDVFWAGHYIGRLRERQYLEDKQNG